MTTTFADFAKGFWDKPARVSKPKPNTPKPSVNGDPEATRCQEQIAAIVQELLNLPALSDTDRR